MYLKLQLLIEFVWELVNNSLLWWDLSKRFTLCLADFGPFYTVQWLLLNF